MEQMWSDSVGLFLKEKCGKVEQRVSLLARTCGLREIEVNDLLAGIPGQDNFFMNLIIRNGGVDVEFFLKNGKYESGNMNPSQLKKEVEKLFGSSLYAWGELNLEEVVSRLLKEKNLTLSVAESCTGGLISHLLTQVPGSSVYFERGIVAYSNRSKQELLGIKPETLGKHGAVSSAVAREMATGIRKKTDTDLGLSVTGIAGPEGGSIEKPVGLVYFGLASPKQYYCKSHRFVGSREAIKMKSALAGLNMLRQYLVRGNVI
jgi:nicotinamide-nucleotide amidase